MRATSTEEKRAAARLDFRIGEDHKALIERAAAYQGETVTGYVVSTLVRDAQRVVRERETASLSDRERERFLDLLTNPPEPTAALRRAARRHRELISRSQ